MMSSPEQPAAPVQQAAVTGRRTSTGITLGINLMTIGDPLARKLVHRAICVYIFLIIISFVSFILKWCVACLLCPPSISCADPWSCSRSVNGDYWGVLDFIIPVMLFACTWTGARDKNKPCICCACSWSLMFAIAGLGFLIWMFLVLAWIDRYEACETLYSKCICCIKTNYQEAGTTKYTGSASHILSLNITNNAMGMYHYCDDINWGDNVECKKDNLIAVIAVSIVFIVIGLALNTLAFCTGCQLYRMDWFEDSKTRPHPDQAVVMASSVPDPSRGGPAKSMSSVAPAAPKIQ